jgi:uncharacterized protein (UPF0264 family)
VEARAAVAGGASIIDVKEPARGPLGRADPAVWREVRAMAPAEIPVSVALGELEEWDLRAAREARSEPLGGIAFRKIGLAASCPGWRSAWKRLRAELGPGPAWIAVVYADWHAARSPAPDEIIEHALETDDCVGILIDTWDKARPSALDGSWAGVLERARCGGLLTVLAGGLDERAIARLAPLAPDFFAVRGAACSGGVRDGAINADRVASLARAVQMATTGAECYALGDPIPHPAPQADSSPLPRGEAAPRSGPGEGRYARLRDDSKT